MKKINFSVFFVFTFLCLTTTAWAYTEVTSITASPNPFNNINGEITTITVGATPGATSLEIKVLSEDESTVVRSGLTLTETTEGVYTATWNGRDGNNAIAVAGNYVLKVFNPATTTYIGPSSIVTVEGISMADPYFTPTGTNAATITVQATPGQTGLKLRFHNNNYGWWYDDSGSYDLPLTETATPGTYTALWDAILYNNYYILPNGVCTIYVTDAAGNQSATTGQITLAAISSVSRTPAQFNASAGETTTITATGVEGLNLQAKVYSQNGSTLLRTLSMTGSGTSYSAIWDGRNESGALVPVGTYNLYIYHTASPARYYASTTVQVSAGVVSVTTTPNPFTPTGTNAATITVQATPGQTGLKLRCHNNNYGWWYDDSGSYDLPLTETATPGTYTASWDAIFYNNYFIMPNGVCTIYVVDAAGNQSATTGQMTLATVSSVSRTPAQFNASAGETTTITATGVEGLNLQAKVYSQNGSTLLRTLSMTGSGTSYSAIWDGRNESGALVPVGTYNLYIYHTASPARYYASTTVQVSAGVVSVTATPNPFTPTGTNAATITVQATPGQTGLKLRFHNNNYGWWYDDSGSYDLPLTETATPGTYTALWDAILYNNYYILPNGVCTIYVTDAAGNQSATTGQITLAAISSVSRTPAQFNASAGETTTITATGVEGLNLQAKVYSQNGSTLLRTLSMTGSGTSYSAIWDGRNESGALVPVGTYNLYIYHTASPARYYASTTVQVSAGVVSVTTTPNPFTPTGTNAATITVQATPGQTGLKLRFHNNNYGWWYDDSGSYDLPLTETATPGTYTASWDAIFYNNYFIMPNGVCTIYVVDAAGNQSATTGQMTLASVSSVSRTPSPFTPGGSNYATISASALSGLNLEARIFNNTTQALTRSLAMTEASGTYTAEWDGKDSNGNFSGANTYNIRIYHSGSNIRYYPTTSIIVNVAVFSISASPDPFVPTGSNQVTITVLADAGQSGLKATVTHPQSGTTPQLSLKEVGSAGTYTTTWNGKFNDVIPNDGICTIRVYDGSGNQFPSTGTLTLSSAKSLTVTPNPFEFEVPTGSTATIRAEMPAELNLKARIGSIKDVPLTGSGAEYTGIWDGKNNAGAFVPSGTYNVTLWNTDTNTRYDLQTSVVVIVIDTTPPNTFITSGPSEQVPGCQSSTFTYSGSDSSTPVGDLQYSLRLDGGSWSEFTSETTRTFINLTYDSHTFEVIAKDLAGNVDPTPAVRQFVIDLNPPVISNVSVVPSFSQATVSWDTDEAATSQVEYGLSDAYGNSTSLLPGLTTTHSIVLTGLSPATTYHYRVKSIDVCSHESVSSDFTFTTVGDTVPPEDVSNLRVVCSETGLVFTWNHSANTAGDLSGYKIYFNNAAEGITLPATQNTYEVTGLNPAAAYPFRITSFDNLANESTGISLTGITLLPNPVNIVVTPYSGYVSLTWNSVSPQQYVSHYAVYVSASNFSSVQGMPPALTTAGTSANVTGLTNNTTYYFAVSAVNLSGCERKEVSPVSGTPVPDAQGPEITDIKLDGVLLSSGQTVNKSGTITLNATDSVGVSRVEFLVDGNLIGTDYNPSYACYLNILSLVDGSHTLTIVAYDTLGNSTSVQFTIYIALVPPGAPTITSPENGLVTNQRNVMVFGIAEKYSEITLYNNNTATGDTASTDALGNFSVSLELTEGENRIQATAGNRAGTSPLSPAVLVTLDSAIPQVPTSLTAQSKESGKIRLTWQPPSETEVLGYNLYRGTTTFSTKENAVRVNTSRIAGTLFEDLPPADGIYFYRVATVDAAENESELSNEASARSDRTMPRASSIEYTPHGNFDPDTGAMAPGRVDIILTVSEALQLTPFLSITPQAGVPISIALVKVSDLQYSGFFNILDTTPSGTAYAVFSGRDLVGNRGTEIDSGAGIKIDTDGPAVSRLIIQPLSPIKNGSQSPVSVIVTMGLNEEIQQNGSPELSYLLSGPGRDVIPVSSLDQITTQSGDVQTWQGTFTLPADAGLSNPETFRFLYRGIDYLDNMNDLILCANLFQVYQGDLPPLEPPAGLKAESLPGGMIRLSWSAVEGASGYQLFRQAPDETELTAYGNRLGPDQLEFTDDPSVDGTYVYAIASVREENGQESVSGMSATVTAISDSLAPEPPLNLELELLGNGIKAEWEAPPYAEDVTFSLYRSSAAEITSAEGLTPIITGIQDTQVTDASPSPAEHCYAVTAVDSAGNESAPSNSYYLNFSLLPVSSLNILKTEDQNPVVSWTHAVGDIAGYNIYLGSEENMVKLNPDLLTELSYTDTGYAGDERRFTVFAVDSGSHESLGRSITLPLLTATVKNGEIIRRGIMNRLEYNVENRSSERIDNIRLKVRVESYDHTSGVFSIGPNTSLAVPVTIGGYDDLPDPASIISTIEIIPNAGEKVEIIRTSEIEVMDGMLVLGIQNDDLVRGGTGNVRFTLENTGDEEIEIITAVNSTVGPSDEIVLYLLDPDGNVLSTAPFKQIIGENVITLPDGKTVARIPAGGIFTSDPMQIEIPVTSPDSVILKLEIAKIHYHLGMPEQVTMDGLSARQQVTLTETSYFGEVLSITPESSFGDEDIIIIGRAVERKTGLPLSGVPLNLVISLDGFERIYAVYTEDDGTFSFNFTPFKGESGLYLVRAVHPDRTDKPVHGQFVISRVSFSPAIINLNIPRNYEKSIRIDMSASQGIDVHNLRLVYDAADQLGGSFPQGINVDPGLPIAVLEAGKSSSLNLVIWADNTADETGTIVLKVKSDETAGDSWGTITVNMSFSEAKPALYFSPDHIETGMALNDVETETIILENRGLADLTNVTLSLVNQNGTAAPGWVSLNSAANQGDMAVGDRREIGISFAPTSASVTEGTYQFYLRVTSSNYPETDILLFAAVTQSGIGNMLFKISDIYTGTVNAANGEIIQGLSNARVRVQNEEVLTIDQTLLTDTAGEVLFSDLPAGRYKCRITADKHQEYIGRFWIKPGITGTKDVFLEYNLVTVEWSVVETTIEDKYEIVLNATYETNVPAPVVVIEPASITLPAMKAGDVYQGEFYLTNYGLIRAIDINYVMPQNSENFKYELMKSLPSSLEAKERVTLPYRVTCLKAVDQEEESGTGGGCSTEFKCFIVHYAYKCSNGDSGTGSVRACWTFISGDCGDFGETYDGVGMGSHDWGGWGWYFSGGGATIGGTVCWVEAEWKEAFFSESTEKETGQNINHPVGCTVNTVMREFNDEDVDLSVKVPGGNIAVKRLFYDNQWKWEHSRNNLLDFDTAPYPNMYITKALTTNTIDSELHAIVKGNVAYSVTGTKRIDNTIEYFGTVYTHDTNKITRLEPYSIDSSGNIVCSGYRWEDKYGNWKLYDPKGRQTSYGTRTGTVGKLLYEPGENGKLIGIADRNDSQVIWYEYDAENHLSAAHDSNNRRVEYHYTNGLLSGVTDILNNSTTYEYDGEGRITRKVDAAGRPTVAAYDSYGNVSSVLDRKGQGHYFTFDYDDVKKEYYARIKTSSGSIKEIWYDRDGETKQVDINGRTIQKIDKDRRNLIITDEKGNVTRKEYDEWDNLTKIIHPDGSITAFEYDLRFNKVSRMIDQRGNATVYEYDGTGNLIHKTEAAGTDSERMTSFTYDGSDQLLTATVEADTDTEAAASIFTYDGNGNLSSITDPEGNTTEFLAYDKTGNPLEIRDPRGYSSTFEYDDMGRMTSQTDPLGNTTSYEFDGANNRTAVINALLKRYAFEYDDHNNLIKTIDPYQKYIITVHNSDNLPTKMIDQEGKEFNSIYDNEGRLIKILDGAGNETVFSYDESLATRVSSIKPVRIDYPTYTRELQYDNRQRIISETDVLDGSTSHTRTFQYDTADNVVSKTDEGGNTTLFEYDALNRVTKITDPKGGIVQRRYDDRGNLIELQDPNNGVTFYGYDRNNRLIRMIRPMQQEATYEYDAGGNLAAVLDAKGKKISYEYDSINRQTRILYYAAGDHGTPVKTVNFTYDKLGNIKTYNDGTTSAAYTYDDLQRKIEESVNYGSFTLSYSYAYYGNGLKKTFTGPDGATITYTYDENNRLTGVAIPGQGQITNNIFQWNSPTKTIFPGGSSTEHVYDPLMRVASITAKDPSQNPIMAYNYEYSAGGNITAKATEHGNHAYEYDALNQLTGAANPTLADEAYTYDPIGNRLTAEGVTGSWTYNTNNELLGYDNVSFDYDENGNMVQKTIDGQVTNFIYNAEDRLARVEDGSSTVIASYYYDPFGRRLWKEAGGVKTYFFYSDEGLIGEYDEAGNEIKTYGYNPGSTWTTDPLYLKVGNTYYWYQNDHLGTPQKVVDSMGKPVWSGDYDSFGNCQIGVEGIKNNLRFAGQYFDAETGLHYNWFRYYDPKLGRYLRTDPLMDGINLYLYVLNNPGNWIDPWGLCESVSGAFNAYNDPEGIIINETSAGIYQIFIAGTEYDNLQAWLIGNSPESWLFAALDVPHYYYYYLLGKIYSEIPLYATIEVIGGHSLGGMEAQMIAKKISGDYNVQRVETYGSPVIGEDVPGVKYNRNMIPGDIVPLLSKPTLYKKQKLHDQLRTLNPVEAHSNYKKL